MPNRRDKTDQNQNEMQMLLDLANHMKLTINQEMPLQQFTQHFSRTRRGLRELFTHPTIDNLIAQVEDNLPGRDSRPSEDRVQEKIQELSELLRSLRTYLQFKSTHLDADWYPKFFIESKQGLLELPPDSRHHVGMQVQSEGKTFDLKMDDIERYFVRTLAGCYKGQSVEIVALCQNEALIDLALYRSIEMVSLRELSNIHEEEFNRSLSCVTT